MDGGDNTGIMPVSYLTRTPSPVSYWASERHQVTYYKVWSFSTQTFNNLFSLLSSHKKYSANPFPWNVDSLSTMYLVSILRC